MIFGTQDYATQEREAWQRGDYHLADVLAALCDAEELVAELGSDEDARVELAESEAAAARDSAEQLERRIEEALAAVELLHDRIATKGSRVPKAELLDELVEILKNLRGEA